MCLYSKTDKPKIAEDNIICYKVLEIVDGVIYTPVINTCIEDGTKTFYAKENISEGITQYDLSLYWGNGKTTYAYNITRSYIHTYKNKSAAEQWCNLKLNNGKKFIIKGCIIPKGSKFYEGDDGMTGDIGYASDKIEFINPINYKNDIICG